MQDLNKIEKKAVKTLIKLLTNSYTSNGNWNVLYNSMTYDNPVVTKDGKRTVDCMATSDEMRASIIYRFARYIGEETEKRAGDGTSTAILAFLKAVEVGFSTLSEISPNVVQFFKKIASNYFKSVARPIDYNIGVDKETADPYSSNIAMFINTSCGASLSEEELKCVTGAILNSVSTSGACPIIHPLFRNNPTDPKIVVEKEEGLVFKVFTEIIFRTNNNRSIDRCYFAICKHLNFRVMNFLASLFKSCNVQSRLFIFYNSIDYDLSLLMKDVEQYRTYQYSGLIPIKFLDCDLVAFDHIQTALEYSYGVINCDEVAMIPQYAENIANAEVEKEFERIFRPYMDAFVARSSSEEIKRDRQEQVDQIDRSIALIKEARNSQKIDENSRKQKIDSGVRDIFGLLPNMYEIVKGNSYLGIINEAKFDALFNTITIMFNFNTREERDAEIQKCIENINALMAKEGNYRIKVALESALAICLNGNITIIKCEDSGVIDHLEDATSAINALVINKLLKTSFIDGSYREIKRFIVQRSRHRPEFAPFFKVLDELVKIFRQKYIDTAGEKNVSSADFCTCKNPDCKGCTLDSILAIEQMIDAICEGLSFSRNMIYDNNHNNIIKRLAI